ncbi:MAG: dTDP-glucose 4,6-dehydratase [Verrucomicrobiia bacterium]
MKTVLVTGGAGFIGSNFVRYLLQVEPAVKIVNLDALTYAGTLENLKGLPDDSRHVFVRGDICDRALVDKLLREHTVDTIAHFAAESHVDRSIHGPGLFVQANIVGTQALLDAARQAWLVDKIVEPATARFHHVSTDEVFGSLRPKDPAFTEATPYDPSSPYSASKAASDHLVRAYARTYGLPVTITNCSNNYGPRQFPEKLIPLMILNGINGRPLPVYGDGQQIRDWLYVEDHCEAIRCILNGGRVGETYNIGGDNQPPNLDIVHNICALLDELIPASPHRPHASLIQHVTDRPGHDRRYAMNITKVRTELGWTPRHSLQTGLRATVQWYLDHPDWIAAIQQQAGYQQWIDRNYAKRGAQK